VVEIRELVRGLRGTRTVLFSSHILSEVEALCERVIVIADGRLVGHGSTAELAGRLGARPARDVRVDGPPDDVRGVLGALAGVDRVNELDGLARRGGGTGPLARRVGAAMQQRGWVVVELRQEALELEEVFLELVRTEGRA
jgi:ABC-2 type transport system ATP-binding protein